MKIEMGESLFYSWLRHVKSCKIVQLNWKTSPTWNIAHEDEIAAVIQSIGIAFPNVFKKNTPRQLLAQAELDAFGINFTDKEPKYFVVDVACHLGGLGYGSKEENVEKVSEKMLRSALILYAYFATKKGNIIFASPKINKSCYEPLFKRMQEIENFMYAKGFEYKFTLIANKDFKEVLNSVTELSDNIADTSELFLRSYQLYHVTQKFED